MSCKTWYGLYSAMSFGVILTPLSPTIHPLAVRHPWAPDLQPLTPASYPPHPADYVPWHGTIHTALNIMQYVFMCMMNANESCNMEEISDEL